MVKVAIVLEVVFVCLEVTLVLTYLVLKHLEGLFVNIHNGDTPFTMENVEHIKKMAYLMIGLIIFPNLSGIIAQIFIYSDLGVSFNLMSLVYILILFSLSYIFEYGYQIQLDSNGKIYGDSDE